IREGFDFLGQNVRKFGKDKLIIRPSEKNFKNFLDKTRKIIRDSTHMHPLYLIRKLNPVIRGWANYHKHVVSKAAFGRADYEITGAILGWARRRHPRKSTKWIKNKYFRTSEQGRDWCFFGQKNGSEAYLVHAMDVPIKRHVKIRGRVNPFDPEHEMYLEKRRDRKTDENIRTRGKAYRLWKEQDGKCPVCRQPITEESGWDNHHITWKMYGGSDASENRILMHPNCHRQVHSLKMKVEKPRPKKGR
ncbi:MAG: group II intron reverse transcriptase/maturase, partial [Desulfobacteraceae bacterium]|nr:group II intron reverse transcriptase/maturase [Desulfobacteraceae bacterium]